MQVKKVAIIGLGVIGGSLGKALKSRKPEISVYGIDVDQYIINEAVKRNIIDWGTTVLLDGIKQADLVVLAVPVSSMIETAVEIKKHLKPGAIITDVGSTKENIVKSLEQVFKGSNSFVGGHPMAGSEKWGLFGANELLFENAAYVLTPTENTSLSALEKVRSIVEDLGAHVIILSPGEHDQKVAAVSHLPHLLASVLVNTVGDLEDNEGGYFSLAAGGFRDSTRIAASQSKMWCDILQQNSSSILPLVQSLKIMLDEIEDTIQRNDSDKLAEFLSLARTRRETVPMGMKGILPQLFYISVTVPDKPGIISEITNNLASQNINISDIEIQLVREEYEGTIRLGFRTEKARDNALITLEYKGYDVQKTGL